MSSLRLTASGVAALLACWFSESRLTAEEFDFASRQDAIKSRVAKSEGKSQKPICS